MLDNCSRDGTRARQHVTMPTGVAETKFDEDPEAEEAALAHARSSGFSTPTSKSAPDSKNGSLQRGMEGMCNKPTIVPVLPWHGSPGPELSVLKQRHA